MRCRFSLVYSQWFMKSIQISSLPSWSIIISRTSTLRAIPFNQNWSYLLLSRWNSKCFFHSLCVYTCLSCLYHVRYEFFSLITNKLQHLYVWYQAVHPSRTTSHLNVDQQRYVYQQYLYMLIMTCKYYPFSFIYHLSTLLPCLFQLMTTIRKWLSNYKEHKYVRPSCIHE